ncbi:MAG TPA: penicillin-binding protein [Myxococcota bacterium]
MRSADVRTSARRVAVVRAALVLAFVGLAARAAHLSVFDQRGAVLGDSQSLRTLTLAPERGHIVDRTGTALALSVDAPSVYAVPSQLEDAAVAARRLAAVLDLDARALRTRLERARGFQFVARWVTPEQERRIEALALPGVGVLREPRRVYPHGTLASRVVGFANIDGRGVRGVEQQEDAWLRGAMQRLPVERDGSGRLMLANRGATRGTAGGDIALALDATLQAEAERALAEAVAATGARGGVVISMDPHSGEIYSLAEHPPFDPNQFRSLEYASTRSGAFLDAVEPGSALKVFLVAGALENGAIAPDELLDCGEGTLRVPGKTIRDAKAHGELDAGGILRVSSNIGAVKVATALGRRRHFETLRRFGFGESTGSRFPDESAGVLRAWRSWQPVDHANIAFGQGMNVTPIQLAAATAVLANGGEWVRPRLVAGRRAADGAWRPTRREAARRVVSRQTAQTVLAMLETVVGPEGTGARAALPGVRVAGKTGTAQKYDAASASYSNERFRAWFVGVVPADDPLLVIVISLDEPERPLHTGGSAAAPLFARVAARQLSHFGIHVDAPAEAPQIRSAAHREPPKRPASGDAAAAAASRTARAEAPAPRALPSIVSLNGRVLLPDFRGLTAAEVMQITESHGLRVKVSGSGRAVNQHPPPGSVVAKGSTSIHVEFGTDAAPAERDAVAAVDRGGRG